MMRMKMMIMMIVDDDDDTDDYTHAWHNDNTVM